VIISIRGRKFRLVRYKAMPEPWADCNGFCCPPRADRKAATIGIFNALGGSKELEVLIHEMLHAGHWDLAEEAVDETARDIAAALWKIGFRKK
jgi:hypothetical protein